MEPSSHTLLSPLPPPQKTLCSLNSYLTLCACTQLYSMYASRFDEAQLGYCKWLKSCKAFAELIRTVKVSLGLLADQHWINRHFTNWKGCNCTVTFLCRFLQLSRQDHACIILRVDLLTLLRTTVQRYLGRGPVYLIPGKSSRKRKQWILFLVSFIASPHHEFNATACNSVSCSFSAACGPQFSDILLIGLTTWKVNFANRRC